MQDTNFFWFTQVISKNLHDWAIKWVDDITQPPSKANFCWEDNQPVPKVSTSEWICNADSL